MKILATDLDRTLLPNGTWESDDDAISIFNDFTKENDLIVVYVTGRSLKLTLKAIKKFNIRYPDVLIGDVGTTIRYFKNGSWIEDKSWKSEVYKKSSLWDADKIQELLFNVEGLSEQEKDKLNEFKQSYYVEIHLKNRVLKQIEDLIKGKFDEEIIYSYDPIIDKGLFDIVPKNATKKTALIHIMNSYFLNFDDVLYAGDSGNDILPLTCGFYAVMVKNADEQTKKSVKEIMKKKSMSRKLYIARGSFNSLNGYYTSGVIEGAYHFNFFK